MTASSKEFGHRIEFRNDTWVYSDNGEPVETTWKSRACAHCHLFKTPEGHDPCIANLPGVINACCGHGDPEGSYIMFEDGRVFRGFVRDTFHEEEARKIYDGQLRPPLTGTDAHRHCNHYHELTDEQEIVDFGTGPFVADKKMVPLLRALNEIGLVTRTHCQGHSTDRPFVGILMRNGLSIEVRPCTEPNSDRTLGEGEMELLLQWKSPGKEGKCNLKS